MRNRWRGDDAFTDSPIEAGQLWRGLPLSNRVSANARYCLTYGIDRRERVG
jgi:hypothetical protein